MRLRIRNKYDFFVFLGVISVISGVIFFFGCFALFILNYFFSTGFTFSEKSLLFLFAIIYATVFSSSFLYAFISFLLKRYMPHSHIPLMSEFDKLERKIASVLDVNELSNLIVNTLFDILKLKNIALLVYNRDTSSYKPASSSGFNINEMLRLELKTDDMLVHILNYKKKGVSRDALIKSLSWQDASVLSHSFARLKANYAFPVIYEGDTIGIVALKPQQNSKRFSKREYHLLDRLMRNLAPALHNANAVTALKRINNNLTLSRSTLVQNAKMSAIEKLATGIAHEIHNPLTIISGKAQVLLLKKKYDSQKVEEVLKTIVEQTKRAAEITRRLLMFSKSEEEENKLIKVEEIINDTVSLVSYHTSLDKIKIVKTFENGIPFIYGNLLEIRELFLNIILNAIQAVGKEGVISISVRHIREKEIIKVSISDTGPGIEDDKLGEIFDPFYTTKKDSVGLGLFICQQIVNKLGGAIIVESDPGKGAVFAISIPAASSNKDGKCESDATFSAEHEVK